MFRSGLPWSLARVLIHGPLLAILLVGSLPSLVGADEPKPAQKDSSPRTKPKDATLSVFVEPARAKPGEVVTLKVTARLKAGWHIYTQAKDQQGDGPRKTVFDVFDTGGLEIAGEWRADHPPEAKAEPAFENKVFEFFADEVTWSLPLKVPATAPAGKTTVRLQASYQICNEKSWSFPGRWTLPEAPVTVLGAGSGAAAAPTSGPKEKDSPETRRPKGVSFTASVEPARAAPGATVKLRVAAKIGPGLHLYALGKQGSNAPGPVPTTFDLFQTSGLEPAGEWTAETQPLARPEPAFDNQIVQYHEGEAIWTIPLRVPPTAVPGPRPIRVQAGYQVCTLSSCYQPGQWTLPAAVVTINSASSGPAPASRVAAADAPPPAPPSSLAPTGPAGASPAPSTNTPSVPQSEIARRAQEGIIPFLIASALGGLVALVMPCVWPMVPITVNFFLKQGQASGGKSRATGLAVAYCLSIIGVFTAVGVFFSYFFSSSFLQDLANNPWLNLAVAVLFLAFGLSLLGLFEIRLPSSLLGASSRGESRGGLVGVFFMALTLTITSFTCTFPVVGGLLVMAASGNFLYPIIGLATFATVLALPFFLLALSPGLLAKMPRSGDWMNTVKVVGGLVEIGAAFKFLNTAELGYVTPENAWFDAHVVLTAWVALAAVCGFYLLGLFRTDHDLDEVKVGPGRLIFGALFLGLSLYMAPALFGRPPRSLVWDRLIIGILPPDADEFNPPAQLAGPAGEGAGERKATSADPAEAERQEKKVHGVQWGLSFEQAKELAAARRRPILIDFTGVNCSNCRLMEQRVLPRPEIVKLLREFVTVQLSTDYVNIASITAGQRKALAEKNQERQLDLVQEATNPFYVVLAPDGRVISTIGGYNEPPVFQDFLARALDQARNGARVAQLPRP